MYDFFKKTFELDVDSTVVDTNLLIDSFVDKQLGELMSQFGGQSFNQGLYRIFTTETISYWNGLIEMAFPKFAGRVTCFAADWLGRVFALDTGRLVAGYPSVILFEPGTAQALNIPCNLESFHEVELNQYREAALSESFYKRWLAQGGGSLKISQCVGYKVPLYLGGKDEVKNLQLTDMQVYWEISAQLINKTRDLPVGTKIDRVSISNKDSN